MLRVTRKKLSKEAFTSLKLVRRKIPRLGSLAANAQALDEGEKGGKNTTGRYHNIVPEWRWSESRKEEEKSAVETGTCNASLLTMTAHEEAVHKSRK